MIAIISILYIGLVVLIYKVVKIKPKPTNVAAMVVLGVVIIGAIVILWSFASPSSGSLIVSRYTVQLVPQVKGPITKIHALPNVPLRKGEDLLYQIQTDTYQNTVDQLTSALDAARRNIAQLEAGGIAADAAVRKAEANREAAMAEFEVAEKTAELNPDAISALRLKQLQQQLNAAEAAVDQSNATAVQAKIGKQAAESTAQSLEAELANAKFNLEQCTVYAPADGFVTNWVVREGTMAVPLPFAPMGTFIDTSEVILVASFSQNVCKYMKPGDTAEIAFKTRPGVVFPATVDAIVQASGEGQISVSGDLISPSDIASEGMLAVKFKLDNVEDGATLAIGTAGTAVVYTDVGKPFHLISKVVVRMNAWKYYLLPF